MSTRAVSRVMRADGRVVEYFGPGPSYDDRTPVVMVAGDDDEVVDAVHRALCSRLAPGRVVAVGSDLAPSRFAVSGAPLDPDVWALVRARHTVEALALVNTDPEAPPNFRTVRRTARPETPVVVGWPDRTPDEPGFAPDGFVVLVHPGRAGLVGLPDKATWIERRARREELPDNARRRAFVHVNDVADAYAAAVAAALRGGASGMWEVGPCPIWDPADAPSGRSYFAPSDVRQGMGALPPARPVAALWSAVGEEGACP